MKLKLFDLTFLLIAVPLNSIRNYGSAQLEFLNGDRGPVHFDSFKHFDCAFYWSQEKANQFILDFKSVDAKCQSVTIPTTFRNRSLESTDSLSSILTTNGLSIIFALLSNHNEVEDFLLMTVNFYIRNNPSKEFWSPYFFIFLNSSELSRGQMEEYAKRFDLSSEVYLISLKNDFTIKSIYEFYHIKNVTIIEDITSDLTLRDYEGRSRLSFWKVVHKASRRSNFHREVIIGANVDHVDYALATKYKHNNLTGEIQFESGFEVEEFFYVRDALNFSDAALAWSDYIKQGPNGTLIGLSTPVNNYLADVGMGATEILEYRASGPDAVTFLHPTFSNEIMAFFKQPAASSVRDVFLSTFSTEVWAATGAIWLIIISSLVTSVHLLRKADQNAVSSLDVQLCRDVIVWSISGICQQGWHVTPFSISVRIIFLVSIVMASLSFNAYSAALVSILSVEIIPVRSFQDLLSYKFNIFSDHYIPTSKAVVTDLEDQGILTKLPNDGRNVDVGINIQKLVKSKIAIVSISDSFYEILRGKNYDAEFVCSELSKVPFPSLPVISSMFVKKGSALREYFNSKIILMKERGVMSILRQHYIRDTSVQCLKGNPGHQPLGNRDVFTAYVILGSGMSLAIIFVFMERIIYSKL